MSWYKSDSECKKEGERAFKQNRWDDRNPYNEYGDYDTSNHYRAWNDGFQKAKRCDEERQEKRRMEEVAEQQRQWDVERQRQQQEQEAETKYMRQEENGSAEEEPPPAERL